MDNKADIERFKKLMKEVHRNGVDELLVALEKSDFYSAPASTRYHDSYEGGLLHHSLRTYDMLRDEYFEFKNNAVSRDEHESLILVSLLHDFCKVGFYTTEMRNAKDENGKWVKVPYYTIDDKYPMGHGEKSVDMARDFIELSAEERLAIRWHMGIQEGMSYGDTQAMSKTYETNTLALLLHVADMKASYIVGVEK